MIAEIGLAALWLAAALAVLQLLGGFIGARREDAQLVALVRPAAILQALLCMTAFGALLWVFAITDLSVKLVASNSHSLKPMIFKLSGAWGNHEGSMLLWVTVMAMAGGLIANVERRLPERTMMATLSAQAFVALGFFAFLLLSSNPFERLDPAPVEGNGLNPLLQDIGLAFHPPTLYIGYVGLSVAFSFAVGALLTRNVTPDFAKVMRPWVLGAWVFLTVGIVAGSYWAYYELGWGGWWFWDPVENASLMPWLAATALLHSVSVLAARDALRTWTIMLGVVAFSMSMLGTFLVRSGILTSVHAFAVDPERGSFILGLLILYIGGALVIFALRANTIAEGKRFALLSREGALVVNNVGLSAILGIVLLGTLYPLLTEAFNVRVSVGPPYFNPVSAVFFLPMLVVLMVGPLLRWRKDSFTRIRLPVMIAVVAALAALLLAWLLSDIGILPLLGLALAAGVAIASVMPLRGRNLRRLPLPVWGMCIAHFGIAVALFGMASDTAFQQERLVAARPGQTVEVGPWNATLAAVSPVAGPNWTAMQGDLLVSYRGAEPVPAQPQSRSFWTPVMETSEVALVTRWNGQLYVAIGNQADDGRWQLRLWWKPFVTFIWYGGLLIALGGVLSLLGRVTGDVRRRTATRRIAARRAEEAAL
ncbi:heme lyase CcmF/NrfE family subunit [Aurantiacibacter gangjinensis]|uniref:Cytochrome C biogenesis protein CcmF n=1 Tax=Aurantiacibacter gangjinensis TaxID=502682 RepID=A0A0G9MQT6_9SPHN|nr:heme lyase CcmF/NrfE family subunit [Aurantiacibacter gangjinensis]APE29000.1 Cytochrome c heme lyase subunit CcmF [Aurantiacibacter gangjinensis]KLE33111.1 cytochrome C biogenesis protein CcmF [Aurantiacibacter gangjinensis]